LNNFYIDLKTKYIFVYLYMDEIPKKIVISGTNNRYKIKQLTDYDKIEKETKKRVQSEKWTFSDKYFEYSNQIIMIKRILNNNLNYFDDVSKIAIQEINKKMYGYKQQDTLKKRYNEEQFLTFESIINKMIECELKCRYCKNEMNVLYDISREMKQWSIDRINNDVGHNIDNYHLACLDCNLKRRRRTDEKFLFTKQLNIVKKENIDDSV
jgi:hypothetical protein